MRSKKCLNLIAPHIGSTVGRGVYHSMAAVAGAAVDVSAVFAVTLAAYQQQQQRNMAVWNLIMDGYDDDTELDAESDESSREIRRRRVYQRKCFFFVFVSLVSLIADGPHHYHPACGH